MDGHIARECWMRGILAKGSTRPECFRVRVQRPMGDIRRIPSIGESPAHGCPAGGVSFRRAVSLNWIEHQPSKLMGAGSSPAAVASKQKAD